EEETTRLLDIIRQLRADGVTVVFVSHFLEEVLAVSDTISVLRDGQHIQTTPASEQTPESIVTAILGREMSLTFPVKQYPEAENSTIFSVRNLSKKGDLNGISFDIRAGEIVGLAGLVGSGRSALGLSIFGAQAVDSGTFEIDGNPVTVTTPTQAIRSGISFLPESRKTQGLLMNFNIAANVTLPHLGAVSKRNFVQKRQELAETAQLLQQMDVRPPRPEIPVSRLSGGNQQKVLFGKWLFRHPKLLIVDEPTHGVDVGARRAIYQLIADLAQSGMGILVISSELEEILGLSHRVLVMRQGSIVAEFTENPKDNIYLSEDDIMHAAFATG
ncbi:MAG: sugar ABC transporter ATP-binding protein, partial [Chloroflexota bacterium]